MTRRTYPEGYVCMHMTGEARIRLLKRRVLDDLKNISEVILRYVPPPDRDGVTCCLCSRCNKFIPVEKYDGHNCGSD